MGITNFCKLLEPLQEYPSEPGSFDSILYDIQSLLHAAIQFSQSNNQEQLLRDIPHHVWHSFYKDLLEILPYAKSSVTLIVSFDGDGVPMKWPTQQQRRTKTHTDTSTDIKSICKMVLFGNNIISLAVQNYFREKLKKHLNTSPFDKISHVYLSGCNVPGEGEHKIFHMAEKLSLRQPIVISIDQDVFILALLRMQYYETLQIYRYKRFYPISDIYQKWFFPVRLEVCSFLFGNDFIPSLISITPTNASTIYRFLNTEEEDEQHPVVVLAHFIQKMKPHLRYKQVTHIDTLLVDCFWVTFFWLKDYYTKSHFPQKYITNPVYRLFDRNQLLTALSEPDMDCYERALQTYHDLQAESTTPQQARYAVFQDDQILHRLKSYWVSPSDAKCIALHATTAH